MDCCPTLSDAATWSASWFGKSESPWPKTLSFFSHITCPKPAWLPRNSLFAMYTPWPLYTTWLWKSHLSSVKVLYSSRAAAKVNGYKTPWNLRGSQFFSREKAVNLTRKDCHYILKMYRSSCSLDLVCVIVVTPRWTAKTNTNKQFLWTSKTKLIENA